MWTCPSCQSTVDDVFNVCWNCGTTSAGVADPSFVKADDQGPIDDPGVDGLGVHVVAADSVAQPSALVEAYRALDLLEAYFLVDRLAEAGFPATSDEQDMNLSLGVWTSGPRVYVQEADLAGARAWLADYDRNKSVTTD